MIIRTERTISNRIIFRSVLQTKCSDFQRLLFIKRSSLVWITNLTQLSEMRTCPSIFISFDCQILVIFQAKAFAQKGSSNFTNVDYIIHWICFYRATSSHWNTACTARPGSPETFSIVARTPLNFKQIYFGSCSLSFWTGARRTCRTWSAWQSNVPLDVLRVTNSLLKFIVTFWQTLLAFCCPTNRYKSYFGGHQDSSTIGCSSLGISHTVKRRIPNCLGIQTVRLCLVSRHLKPLEYRMANHAFEHGWNSTTINRTRNRSHSVQLAKRLFEFRAVVSSVIGVVLILVTSSSNVHWTVKSRKPNVRFGNPNVFVFGSFTSNRTFGLTRLDHFI